MITAHARPQFLWAVIIVLDIHGEQVIRR